MTLDSIVTPVLTIYVLKLLNRTFYYTERELCSEAYVFCNTERKITLNTLAQILEGSTEQQKAVITAMYGRYMCLATAGAGSY